MKTCLSLVMLCVFAFSTACAGDGRKAEQSDQQNESQAVAQKTDAPKNLDANQRSEYRYVISVTHGGKALGDIHIELWPDVAPKHVANFDSLVSIKFYDGTAFHRVIPGFMIQGGDPNSKDKPKATWGQGAPGQRKIPAEFSDHKHVPGIISAARTNDPNSATSQFFIMVGDSPWLDGQYSIYGKVTKGQEIVDKIVAVDRDTKDKPNEKVEMTIKKVKS